MVLTHRSLDDDDVLAQVAFHDAAPFSRWCPRQPTITSLPASSPAASGMYVAVAVGPRGGHGGIRTALTSQASTYCSGWIASMEAGL
jgi:hypothetical protein